MRRGRTGSVPVRMLVSMLVALALLVWGPDARAIDWAAHADEQTVKVVTTNEDGSLRITTVWLVVMGADAFVRAGGGRWGKNVERDPDVRLLTKDQEYDLRVEFLTADADREPVISALRAKYGLQDRLLNVFRGRRPKVMRLAPRPAGG